MIAATARPIQTAQLRPGVDSGVLVLTRCLLGKSWTSIPGVRHAGPSGSRSPACGPRLAVHVGVHVLTAAGDGPLVERAAFQRVAVLEELPDVRVAVLIEQVCEVPD